MKEMKTLTVNGETYTVADPDSVSYTAQDLTDEQKAQARANIDAAHMDDSKIGPDAWSSKNTVDKLCPSFAKSGAVVTCEPVEGYPLQVISRIEPIQEGNGDPTPEILGDNIYNTGWVEAAEERLVLTPNAVEIGATYRFAVNTSVIPSRIVFQAYTSDGGERFYEFYDTNACAYVRENDEESLKIFVYWANGVPEGWDIYDNVDCAFCPVMQKGNIRPISGHSAVKLWRGEKNLFDFVGLLGDESYSNTLHGVTAELNDGMVHLYGTNTNTTYVNPLSSPRFSIGKYPIPPGTYTLPRVKYTHDGKTYQVGLVVQLHDKELAKNTNYSGTFTITKTLYLVFFYAAVDYAGHTLDVEFPLMMVAGTDAPTAYEPYSGETFTIDFGQSVYGGSYNWQTGELAIDRKMITLDGSEYWLEQATHAAGKSRYGLRWENNQQLLEGAYACAKSNVKDSRLLCSKIKTSTADDTYMCREGISTYFTANQAYIYIYLEQYATDFEGFKEMMRSAQIVFGLAEPITVQLTPKEILALSGENTLYSDTGDTQVSGKAHPGAIIASQQDAISRILERVAALEAAAVNNA